MLITAIYVIAGITALFGVICTAMEWDRIASQPKPAPWPTDLERMP
jgi:hypothetical protein